MTELPARTAAKRAAGRAAAERYVRSGMRVGLGTGSTAVWATRRIGELLAEGSLVDVVGVPTSRASRDEAIAAGVPLTTLDEHPRLDVAIDGADEVSPALDLIKGGGGAHLHEKVVAQASARFVVVVDEAKLVPALGTAFPVPVEVVPVARHPEQLFLESLGARVTQRTDGVLPYETEEGDVILDATFGPIDDPGGLLARLDERAGIVAVGLFVGMASVVVIAGADGEVRELSPRSATPAS